MWSIAVKTLIADRGKLLTALVGVIFSVVLVNVQGGLFLGMIRKAGLLIDHGEADIWVGHRDMHNVDFPRDIPERWVQRIRSIPAVERADPYLIGFGDMTLPSGGFEGVTIVGMKRSYLGGAWNFVQGTPAAMLQPDGIVIDQGEDVKLEQPCLGEVREINGRRARIAAKTEGIMGFLVAPYVFTTYDRAAKFLNKDTDACSYILVQLESGADPDAVCRTIRQRIPEAEAATNDQYSRTSVNFWMTRTGLGISFGAATALGVLVGLVMVAQTLYALVLDRLGEYGTLKAIGGDDSQIFRLLLAQATMMAVAGSLLGMCTVLLIQWFGSTSKAPILIPAWLSIGSCLLVFLICSVSSILPYLRIRKLDPVTVLQ